MSDLNVPVVTDTATISIFDVLSIRHRKDDVGDWWSLPWERTVETAARKALFVDLGDDGIYQVEVSTDISSDALTYCLDTPSGQLFIGPGEETSGGGFEPDGKWGGVFVPVIGPHQKIGVIRDTQNISRISIGIESSEPFENSSVDMIRI